MPKILITGGAGFVGSQLAFMFKSDDPKCEVTVLDNLKRRGSELNLPTLKDRGIRFVHGDIRQPSDLTDLEENFDLLIEASAEPSVLAGVQGSPAYVIQTNLVGTLNCLEYVRKKVGKLIFLSTSRVYSLKALSQIALKEGATRFESPSLRGICEDFPTQTARSFYGASKLASEMMIQEYANQYGMEAIINRCGVLSGPGQFGKTDQGVFTLWVANHHFNLPLQYTGYGGEGKQVRDLLHPRDLYALIQKQIPQTKKFSGEVFNVGGGLEISTSLKEYTVLCQEATHKKITIGQQKDTHSVDIPWYITDNTKVSGAFDWQPKIKAPEIVKEIAAWIAKNEAQLRFLFC